MAQKPLKKPERRPADEESSSGRRNNDDSGLSLEELSQAFSQLINTGHDPYVEVPESDAPPVTEDEPQAAEEGEGKNAFDSRRSRESAFAPPAFEPELSPRSILEAMLFVGMPDNSPLTSRQIAGLMRGVRPEEIDDLIRELNLEYQANRCPYFIAAAGEGYRLTLREEFARLKDKFQSKARHVKLSPLAVEVLAVVAYNEPQTREQIEDRIHKPCGSVLTQLVRKNLLKVEHAQGSPKKDRSYCTTPQFLELFGLQSLEELPSTQITEVL